MRLCSAIRRLQLERAALVLVGRREEDDGRLRRREAGDGVEEVEGRWRVGVCVVVVAAPLYQAQEEARLRLQTEGRVFDPRSSPAA